MLVLKGVGGGGGSHVAQQTTKLFPGVPHMGYTFLIRFARASSNLSDFNCFIFARLTVIVRIRYEQRIVEIVHEIFSTVILSLPLIQERQLSVSGERMCTILVNRLED